MNLLQLVVVILCCLPLMTSSQSQELSPSDLEKQQKFKASFLECYADLGITLAPSDNLTETVMQAHEFNKTCWSKCYLEATGMVDSKGILKTEGPVNHIISMAKEQKDDRTAARAGDIVSTCQTMKPIGDPCMDAPKYMRCLISNMDRVILSNYFKDVAIYEIRKRYGKELLERFPSLRFQAMADEYWARKAKEEGKTDADNNSTNNNNY